MIPVLRQNTSARMMNDLIYMGLAGLTGKRQEDVGLQLADDITQDRSDKSIYHIKLRIDVKWHDGRMFSADDVIYTWQVITDQRNDSPLRGRLIDIVDSFEKVGSHEVTVDFRHPVAPDDAFWLMTFKIIPCQHFGISMPTNLSSSTTGRNFAASPVGSGPYSFVERKSNTLVLESASEYSSLRRVRFQIQRDPDVGSINLTKGRTDMVFEVDPDLYGHLDERNFPYAQYEPKAFYALALNTSKSPLTDVRVREAIAIAIDRVLIYSEVFNEVGDQYLMRKPFPNNDHRLYQRLEDIQTFDPGRAAELLNLSAYGGQELSLIYPRMMGSVGQKTALMIALMLENVGFSVKVKEAGNNFYANLGEGHFDIALMYEGGFGRKYNHFDLYYSNGQRNVSRIADQKLDDLLLQWHNSIVMDTKFPLARKINSLLGQLHPYAYLFAPPVRVYHTPQLHGVIVTDGDAVLATLPDWTKG